MFYPVLALVLGVFLAQTLDICHCADARATTATLELILHTQDNIRTSKYVRGMYSSAGAVMKVEGNLEQVIITINYAIPDIYIGSCFQYGFRVLINFCS